MLLIANNIQYVILVVLLVLVLPLPNAAVVPRDIISLDRLVWVCYRDAC